MEMEARLREELYRQEIRLREKIERARNNFPEFIRRVFKTVSPGHTYQHNWHIDAISEYLEACRRGEIRKLVINMPPRSLKSIACTIAWPAFLLGHDPSTQIMCASYAQALSYKHSQDTREVMRSAWYQRTFPDTILSRDQNEKGKFTTTARGHRMAVSCGSAATGEGGDYLIADDVLNPEQSVSDKERDTANRWYRDTWTSRQNDKRFARMLLVMQRLHENDPTGMLQEKGGCEILCLQSKFEKRQTISIGKFTKTVEAGELLDPNRLSQEVLDELKRDMTAQAFAGQYQQDPSPDEGGILKKKHWRVWEYDKPPECLYVVQSYDTAFSEKETGDYTARTTWGIFNHKGFDEKVRFSAILLEATQARWSYPEMKADVIASAKLYNPDVILIEKKASGQSLIQDLRAMGKHRIIAARVDGGKHSADKVARANIAAIVLEKGAIWTMNRDWKDIVIKQCAQFPSATHDDIVDSCVQAWLWLRNRFWIGIPDDYEEDMNLVRDQRKALDNKSFYGHSAVSTYNTHNRH